MAEGRARVIVNDAAGSDATNTLPSSGYISSRGSLGARAVARVPELQRYVPVGDLVHGRVGVVQRVYDATLRREVALKTVRLETLSVERHAALLGHVNAMAQLSHPNIVAIYDVETARLRDEATSELRIAMEFVHGTTLAELLKIQRPWREVLALFTAAGRGLVAAHDAGLVHGGFSARQVLVGDDGRPRVTDFGLAGIVMGADAAVSGDATIDGSPAREARPADDSFAFCSALWEALTGHPAIVDASAHRLTWPRDVLVPRKFVQALIIGLHPDPSQRWPSLRTMLDELELELDPHRRWRALAIATVLAVPLCVAGLALAGWKQARAERCTGGSVQLAEAWNDERKAGVQQAMLGSGVVYAADAWAYVQPRLDAYASAWIAMYGDACEATALRGEQSPEILDLRMACLERAKVAMRAVTNVLMRSDAQVVEKAAQTVAGLPSIDRCADLEALDSEVPPPDPQDQAAVAEIRAELAEADALRAAGKFAEALTRVDAVAPSIDAVAYVPLQTELWLARAPLSAELGNYQGAERSYRNALRSGLRLRQWGFAEQAASALARHLAAYEQRFKEGRVHAEVARGLLRHGTVKAQQDFHETLAEIANAAGRYAEAEAELRAALALERAPHGAEDSRVAYLLNKIGGVVHRQGRYAEAEVDLRAALERARENLGPEHPDVADSHNSLAQVLKQQGHHVEAEAEYRTALAIYLRNLGPEHPYVATVRNNLGTLLSAQGYFAEAEAEFRASLASDIKGLGAEHFYVALTRNNLGMALCDQGRFAEAESELRIALESKLKRLGSEHPDVATTRSNLATVLSAQERHAEAEAELRLALAIDLESLGAEHPELATTRCNLGTALNAQRRYVEAEAELRMALAILLENLGPEHLRVATTRTLLGVALSGQGRQAEAEAELRMALLIDAAALGEEHPTMWKLRLRLVSVLVARGKHSEAIALLEEAWTKLSVSETASAQVRAATGLALAEQLWRTRAQRPKARRLADVARSLLADARFTSNNEVAEQRARIDAWLQTHRL